MIALSFIFLITTMTLQPMAIYGMGVGLTMPQATGIVVSALDFNRTGAVNPTALAA